MISNLCVGYVSLFNILTLFDYLLKNFLIEFLDKRVFII